MAAPWSPGWDIQKDTNVHWDQSCMLHHIDFSPQMKHFAICPLVSLLHFQWKSMVIKINQQKAALYFSAPFGSCYCCSCFVFFLSFFWAVLSSQLITLQVILQISDTLPVKKRVWSGCDKNNISIIDQQLLTAAGFIVWSSMVKLYRKMNIKRDVMIYSVQSMKS